MTLINKPVTAQSPIGQSPLNNNPQCIQLHTVRPRAAELAAGRKKIAASRQPGRKKYAAKPPPKIRLTAAFPRDVKKN